MSETTKQDRKLIYYLLTKYLTTNTISVIIGIFSGIAINLYTNESGMNRYSYSIILLLISVLLLLFLVWLNEQFNFWFAIKKTDNLKISQNKSNLIKSDPELWKEALSHKKYLKILYFTLIFFSVLPVIFAICLINRTNRTTVDENYKKESEMKNQLNGISEQLKQANLDLKQQNYLIKSLSNSIANIEIENRINDKKPMQNVKNK